MINNQNFQTKLNKYLLVNELQKLDIFPKEDNLIVQEIKEYTGINTTVEDIKYIINYLFTRFPRRRTLYLKADAVPELTHEESKKSTKIDMYYKIGKTVKDLSNISKIQSNSPIENSFQTDIKSEEKPYSTNEVGEEVAMYQILGKNDKSTGIKAPLITYIDRMSELYEFNADKTQKIMDNFVKSISHMIQ